ncbi:MAG TPA: type II toxin-antitoxin system prevent-host-death family antitoxin [Gallionella sp.]|nr:type II toxin-antitoxin system prevent-host-death family antitoxin [Gallionella sp.]
MQTVNIHEAKTQFSRIVEQAEAGEEIVIARAGKPVARLVSLESAVPKSRKLGLGKKLFTFPADFDNLHAGEIATMFEQGK